MAMTLGARINTAGKFILYLDFIIEQSTEGWEWTHKDYATNGITCTSDTVFDAIEAVEDWHAKGHELPAAIDPDWLRDERQGAG